MQILRKYVVGVTEVKILRNEDGSYYYLAEDVIGEEINELVRKYLVKAIQSLREIQEVNSVNLAKKLKEILEERGFEVDVASLAYLARRELKYKKLQVLVEDPYIEDISIVGTGNVWVRHKLVLNEDPEVDYIPTNIVIESKSELVSYMNLLAEKAGKLISKSNPILDANLPPEDGGHRIHIVLPEVAGGEGELVVRKKNPTPLVSLSELMLSGTIPNAVVTYIDRIIRSRGSIIIAGPPGSGKTTLLRAILYELIPKEWKIAIIEDTPEIDPPKGSTWVRYVTPVLPWREKNSIDQMILAKAALRASVNRFIVIGETRGEEAKVLTQAMNMGLGGLTTFHAGSSEETVTRLMSPPINLSPPQIGMFWSIIVLNFVGKNLRRCVTEVTEPIYDTKYGELKLNTIYTYGEELNADELLSRSVKLRRKVGVATVISKGRWESHSA